MNRMSSGLDDLENKDLLSPTFTPALSQSNRIVPEFGLSKTKAFTLLGSPLMKLRTSNKSIRVSFDFLLEINAIASRAKRVTLGFMFLCVKTASSCGVNIRVRTATRTVSLKRELIV